MPISCSSNNIPVVFFHNEIKKTFSPLPSDGKRIQEIIKRICLVVIAPLAYIVLGIVSPIYCAWDFVRHLNARAATPTHTNLQQTIATEAHELATLEYQEGDTGRHTPNSSDFQGVYFVRYLGIKTTTPNYTSLQQTIATEVHELATLKYQKGACLYTPNSVQPMAAFDPRHAETTQIAVPYPFALLIHPKKVELHYWSILDMDRNWARGNHESAKKSGAEKYKPENEGIYHNLFAKWKTVHFTGVECFIQKVETISKAVRAGKDHYVTRRGKKKNFIDQYGVDLTKNHNEGSITYDPHTSVEGILIRNTPEDIRLATVFKNTYQDSQHRLAFKNAFLAYQNSAGKIVKIS